MSKTNAAPAPHQQPVIRLRQDHAPNDREQRVIDVGVAERRRLAKLASQLDGSGQRPRETFPTGRLTPWWKIPLLDGPPMPSMDVRLAHPDRYQGYLPPSRTSRRLGA